MKKKIQYKLQTWFSQRLKMAKTNHLVLLGEIVKVKHSKCSPSNPILLVRTSSDQFIFALAHLEASPSLRLTLLNDGKSKKNSFRQLICLERVTISGENLEYLFKETAE